MEIIQNQAVTNNPPPFIKVVFDQLGMIVDSDYHNDTD